MESTGTGISSIPNNKGDSIPRNGAVVSGSYRRQTSSEGGLHMGGISAPRNAAPINT